MGPGQGTALIHDWIERVKSRPQRTCGIFLDDTDGQPFGSRARPWDEPDLLVDASFAGSRLILQFDRYGSVIDIEISNVSAAVPGDHPWGACIDVTGESDGAPITVQLV